MRGGRLWSDYDGKSRSVGLFGPGQIENKIFVDKSFYCSKNASIHQINVDHFMI